MKKYLYISLIILLFTSCSFKNPKLTSSATIIFKTKDIKFYDRGFISKYDNYINLQIYNSGNIALNLNIYKDTICKSTFKCMSSSSFNKKYLSSTYSDDFLYKLFQNKKIYFKDKPNHILIKVKYD